MTFGPGGDRPPDVVVVGAASRDLTDDDPRGWRLGGGVSYSAMTCARLGLRTVAIIGVDDEASGAWELDLLRRAGCDVRPVALATGPVFLNVEVPEGRSQVSRGPSDPVPVTAIPDDCQATRGWLLVPVAGELSAAWADPPAAGAFVAVGWQGLLRELEPDAVVRRHSPGPDAIVSRATLVGVSRDDVEHDQSIEALTNLLGPEAELVLTQGDRGGIVATRRDGVVRMRRYPALRSQHVVDPTGAGDVFLAALAAARIEPRLVGGRGDRGFDLLLAAAAASLVIEGPGLLGVPDRQAVRARLTEGRQPAAS